MLRTTLSSSSGCLKGLTLEDDVNGSLDVTVNGRRGIKSWKMGKTEMGNANSRNNHAGCMAFSSVLTSCRKRRRRRQDLQISAFGF